MPVDGFAVKLDNTFSLDNTFPTDPGHGFFLSTPLNL